VTTVAYRDGVIACDTQVSRNDCLVGYAPKAGRIGRLLYGFSGELHTGQAFYSWLKEGASGTFAVPESVNATCICVVEGRIVEFGKIDIDYMRAPFVAIGSGWEVATGAMLAGATATEAVRAAAKVDLYTGGDILEFKL